MKRMERVSRDEIYLVSYNAIQCPYCENEVELDVEEGEIHCPYCYEDFEIVE